MSTIPSDTHLDHPLYQTALRHLQLGEWEKGLKQLQQLSEAYPLDVELRALRQEMLLRAKVDEDEKVDRSTLRRHRLKSLFVRLVVVVVLACLAILTIGAYSRTFQEQWVLARQTFEGEVYKIELAARFRDAQDLMQAGRFSEALKGFEAVAALDPEYPELDAYIERSEKMVALNERYEEALRLINLDQLPEALEILQEISAQERLFLDVAQRITNLENQILLEEQLAQAEAAFEEQHWEESVALYESIRALDPSYQATQIEERLYASYVNAAGAILLNPGSLGDLQRAEELYRKALALRPQDSYAKEQRDTARQRREDQEFFSLVNAAQQSLIGQEDSLIALTVAEGYWQQALEIRPNDPEISLQRRLAQNYLKAQESFKAGVFDDVIENLEFVYSQDREYALGTARQTLYEAYKARGDSQSAKGEFELALADYQRAAELADEGPDSVLRLYEAQIELAEVNGKLGEYETAVLLYRSAADLGGLWLNSPDEHPELMAALEQAEDSAAAGDYREALLNYQEAVRYTGRTYETTVHVVQLGEYLTAIAARYRTTVSAIAEANNIPNPNRIFEGQELLIPVLPGSD